MSSYVPKYEALVEFIKGSELFLRTKYEECIERFDRANEIDPNYLLPLNLAAVAYSNRGQDVMAEQYVERMKQIPNLSQGEINFRDWWDAHLKGDNESTFRITQKLEKISSGTVLSYQLALEAIRTNRPQTAVEASGRLDPESVHINDWVAYWGVLTQAYHMLGQYKQEFKEALQAQRQYPESWSPLLYKTRALAAMGRVEKVADVIKESKAKPMTSYWNPARLMTGAGVQLKAHGYLKESNEMFEKALMWLRQKYEEDPPSDGMTYQLAAAFYHTLDFTGAAELLKDLHERYPEDLDYLGFLGFVEAKRGNSNEAQRIFEKIEALDEPYLFGDDTAWLAFIAGALGEKDKAISLLRSALSQGLSYATLYQNKFLEPLWDYPAFIELIKPKN